MTMGETEEFNPLTFEKRLTQLKDTQESIQSLSSWCLQQREHHKKIVQSWLNVLKRVKVEQRLVLFYLANDVIQYSKRKNYDFVESWGLNLQKATPLVRDEKVRHKILRIFKIWEQRSVYDEEFLSDLTGLLSAGALKKTDDDPLDFQPQQLVNKIKQCTVLEADTDLRLKYIHESHLQLSDADALCANLKDRSNKDDVEKELNEGIQCVEKYTQALQREIVAREALLALLTTANQYYSTQRGEVKVVAYDKLLEDECVEKYTQALQREIVAREALLALLTTANQYYSTQRGEVKVVAYAYKNFGARVRALKRKLDELMVTLPPRAPSPPRHDEDVPSPGPDEDLDLPTAGLNDNDVSYNIDQTFNSSMTADGSLYNLGLSSFLSTENPMAMFNDSDIADTSANNSNKIEVINSRPNEKQDFDINNFLKTLVPNDTNTPNSDSNSGSGTVPPADPALPGLDLLTESDHPAPPTSFYGSINEEADAYHPEINSHQQWNNNSWSIPPAPVPPPLMAIPPPPAPLSVPTIPLTLPSNIPVPSTPVSNIPVSNIPVTNIPVSNIPVSIPVSRAFADTPESPPPAPPPRPAPVVPVYTHNTPATPVGIPVTNIPVSIPVSRAVFADTPESPPPAPPPRPAPVVPVYTHNTPDMPSADVDHRGLLPPPPPPPVLPLLGNIEDVDHRLLQIPPPPPPVSNASTPGRHSTGQQDVDHRNLISLTHQPPQRPTDPRTASADQDYRVPPLIPPNDVVEIVDMDLSEDEDQQGMYPNEHRRNTFNNNKVLVGGDNGKTNHNLVQINREQPTPPAPLSNPFDNMPVGLKEFNMPPFEKGFGQFPPRDDDEKSNDSAYEDDLRSRGIDHPPPAPDRGDEFPDFTEFKEFEQRPMMNNHRFPRNWGPRNNFRPPFGGPPMRPWNGPRPPPNRWMGPRQRFW